MDDSVGDDVALQVGYAMSADGGRRWEQSTGQSKKAKVAEQEQHDPLAFFNQTINWNKGELLEFCDSDALGKAVEMQQPAMPWAADMAPATTAADAMDEVHEEDEEEAAQRREKVVRGLVQIARAREPHARVHNSWPSKHNKQAVVLYGIDVHGQDCYPYKTCTDPTCPACGGPAENRLTEPVKGPAWQTDPKTVRPDTVDYVCAYRMLAEPLIHKWHKKQKESIMKMSDLTNVERHGLEVKTDRDRDCALKKLMDSHKSHCDGAATKCPGCVANGGVVPEGHWGYSHGLKCCVMRCIPVYRQHLAAQYQSPHRTQLYDIHEKGLELVTLADIIEKEFLQDPLKGGRAVCHAPRKILQYVWAADELSDTKFALLHHEGKKNNPTGDKKRRQHATKPSRMAAEAGDAQSSAADASAPAHVTDVASTMPTMPTIQRVTTNPLRTSHDAHNLPENHSLYPFYSFFRPHRRLGPEKMNRVTGPHLVLNHTTGTGPFKSFDDPNVTNNPLDPYANRVAICHASDCLTTEGAHLRSALGVHIDLAKPFLVVERRKAHDLTVDQSASRYYQPNLYACNYQRKLYDVRRLDLRRVLATCSSNHEVYKVLRDDGLKVPLRENYDDNKEYVAAARKFVDGIGLCSTSKVQNKWVFKPLRLDDTTVQTALFDELCEGDVHTSRANDRIVLVPPEREGECMLNYGASGGEKVYNLYSDLRKYVEALRAFGCLGVIGPVADALMTQKRMEGNHTRVPAPEVKTGPQFGGPQNVAEHKIPAMRLLRYMEPANFVARWAGYKAQEQSKPSKDGSSYTTYAYLPDDAQKQGQDWPLDKSGEPMSELDVACELYDASTMRTACSWTQRAAKIAKKHGVVLPNACEIETAKSMRESCNDKGTEWYDKLVDIRTYRVVDYFITTPAFSDYHMNAVVKQIRHRTNAAVGQAVRDGAPVSAKWQSQVKKAITTHLLRAANTHGRAYADYVTQMAARDELSLRVKEYAKLKQRYGSSKELASVYAQLIAEAETTLGRSGGGQQAWRALGRTGGAAVGSGLREAVVRSSVDARPIYGGDRNRSRLSRKPPTLRVLTDADAFGTATETNASLDTCYKAVIATITDSTTGAEPSSECMAFAAAYESLVRAKRLRKFCFQSCPGATGPNLATPATIRFVVVLCLDITRLLTGYTCRHDRDPNSLWCQGEKFAGHPGFVTSLYAKAAFPAIAAAYDDFSRVFNAYLGKEKGLSEQLESSALSEQVLVSRIALIRSGNAIVRTPSDDVHGGAEGTCKEVHTKISVWECAIELGGEAVLRYLSAIRMKRLEQLELEFVYHCLYQKECQPDTAEAEQWKGTFDYVTKPDLVCADRSILCTLWCTNTRDDVERRCTIADALRELFASGTVSLHCLRQECKLLLEFAKRSEPGDKDVRLKSRLNAAAQHEGSDDSDPPIVDMLDEFLNDLNLWNNWRWDVVNAMQHFGEAVKMASAVMRDAMSASGETGWIFPSGIYRRDDRDERGGLTPSQAIQMWGRCKEYVARHRDQIAAAAMRLRDGCAGCANSAAFRLFASSANAIHDLVNVLTLVSDDELYARLLGEYATLVSQSEIDASDTLYVGLVNIRSASKPQPDRFVKLYQAEVQPFYWNKLTDDHFAYDLSGAYGNHRDLKESEETLRHMLDDVQELNAGDKHDWRVDTAFNVEANDTLIDLSEMNKLTSDDDKVVSRLVRVNETLRTEKELQYWLSTQSNDSRCITYGTLRPATASYGAVCAMLYERHRPGSAGRKSIVETDGFNPAPAAHTIVQSIPKWGEAKCIARLLHEHRWTENRTKLDDCKFRQECTDGVPNAINERKNLRAAPNGAAKQAVFGAFDDDENATVHSARCHLSATELQTRMNASQFELIRDAEKRVDKCLAALPQSVFRTVVPSSPRPRVGKRAISPRAEGAASASTRPRTTPSAGSTTDLLP